MQAARQRAEQAVKVLNQLLPATYYDPAAVFVIDYHGGTGQLLQTTPSQETVSPRMSLPRLASWIEGYMQGVQRGRLHHMTELRKACEELKEHGSWDGVLEARSKAVIKKFTKEGSDAPG